MVAGKAKTQAGRRIRIVKKKVDLTKEYCGEESGRSTDEDPVMDEESGDIKSSCSCIFDKAPVGILEEYV
ncbi:hypothetical protein E2C01_071419 [Portunus trituberculatus]|uniref:Uncharacterized protein n=1 Tax=Portunus trituberculatus TaxID=210409 RepID=A0A5B7HZX4_PORTR|nr:hypothetical protein [Portunus trituberculatus]